MFEIIHTPIEELIKEKDFFNARVGGVVTFEGKVRNHNEGLQVNSLEYQAYESMAINEGQKITEKAMKHFDVVDVYCVHRVGHLKIGEMAVWVVALAEHRAEAFKVCEYIIDTVKKTVPIWKREHYVAKEAKWIACHKCGSANSHNHIHNDNCGHR
jgi:molybdopterin synthase catalytic subunit